MMKNRTPLAAATAIVTALGILGLSACANPVEQLIQQGTESALEDIIEQQSGGKVDIDSDSGGATIETDDGTKIQYGGNVALPDEWPGLPLPGGELIGAATSAEGGIVLTYRTTVDEGEKLLQTLERDGYETEQSSDMGEMKIWMLRHANGDTVNLSWIVDDDGTIALQYMAGFSQE